MVPINAPCRNLEKRSLYHFCIFYSLHFIKRNTQISLRLGQFRPPGELSGSMPDITYMPNVSPYILV